MRRVTWTYVYSSVKQVQCILGASSPFPSNPRIVLPTIYIFTFCIHILKFLNTTFSDYFHSAPGQKENVKLKRMFLGFKSLFVCPKVWPYISLQITFCIKNRGKILINILKYFKYLCCLGDNLMGARTSDREKRSGILSA